MTEPYVGEIRMFAGDFAPEGWAFCDGQLMSINENELLFSLIGTRYGGDGGTTFALPDLRGRLPINQGINPQTGTTYELGKQGGVEKVTLRSEEIPSHTHRVACTNEKGTLESPQDAIWAKNVQQYSTNAPNEQLKMHGGIIGSVGGNQPHDNMMPFLALRFIIALHGIYPSQD